MFASIRYIGSLFIITFLLASYASQSATAAAVLATSLRDGSSLITYATGTDSVSGSNSVAGGGFISGTVDIVGTEITATSAASTGGGTTARSETIGSYTYSDLIFTNILNPGDIGMISVSANFFLQWTTTDNTSSDFIQVIANINGGVNDFNTIFNTQIATDIATAFVLVPLNEAVEFNASYSMRITDSAAGTELGNALYRLEDFTLPEGFTVNSAEAGIVNNAIGAIPLPAALPLYGTGLAVMALIGLRRNNWGQSTFKFLPLSRISFTSFEGQLPVESGG